MRHNNIKVIPRIRLNQHDKVIRRHREQPVSQSTIYWESVQQQLPSGGFLCGQPCFRYIVANKFRELELIQQRHKSLRAKNPS